MPNSQKKNQIVYSIKQKKILTLTVFSILLGSFFLTLFQMVSIYSYMLEVPSLETILVTNVLYISTSTFSLWIAIEFFRSKLEIMPFKKMMMYIILLTVVLHAITTTSIHIGLAVVDFRPFSSTRLTLELILNELLSISSVGFLLYYFEEHLKYVERAKADLRTQVLQLENRLQPEFFFNSLNSLLDLVNTKDDQASFLIEKLSDFYSLILREPNLIKLTEELKICDYYIQIENVRLNQKITFKWYDNFTDVGEHIEDLLIPSLILQNLLEAVILFIEKNDTDEESRFRLTIEKIDSFITIKLLGNGIINNNYHELEESVAITLENNTQRIQQYFGDNSELSMLDVNQKYFTILIKFPYIV